MPAVVIRDGRIVLPEGIIRGELSIENGKIGTIALTGIPRGDVEIRARGGLVIPGAIDGHTHFYSRKYIYRENFRTGSIAAAAGGVTTVAVSLLDDPIKTPKKAREVIEFGEKNSMVDFMLHAGNLTPGSIKNMVKLASIGIRSFKVSNCYPNPCSYEGMGRMMELATKLDSLMIAYPEDVVALREVRRKLIREGKRDILAYMQGHPAEAEERGIEKIAEMALRSNCPVHFAPVTTESGSKVVSSYKKKRSRVTAETCPHYLVFSAEDFKRMGPWIKVSPPIRSPGDVAALWSAIEDGTIDMVTSGHAPTTKAEKMGKISVWGSPSGIPSLETLIPVLFTEGVARGRMSVEKMVSLLSSRPAQIFGLYPRKGVIREGSDADLVLLDVRNEVRIRAENLHYSVDWTPYEGMKVKGIPLMAISRGEILLKDGAVEYRARRGKFLGPYIAQK